MEQELVSVLIPTCNEYRYLKKSIESILGQTYHNLEVIVIDSSDDVNKTKSLIHLEDKRVHYFYRKKNGLADALNYGIENANGKYIARMDADDISKANRIEKQVDFFEKNADISILGSSFEVIDEKDIIKNKIYLPASNDEIFAKLLFENPLCHPSIMFRKRVFSDGNRYRKVFSEDYDLWTRLILKYKFANLSDILLKYRVHGTNLSIVGDVKVKESVCKSTKELFGEIIGSENSQFEDIDYIKNDRLQWIESEIIESKDAFFLRQFRLIEQFQMINVREQWADEDVWNRELKERWKLLWGLTSVIRVETQKIIDGFNNQMNWNEVREEYLLNEKQIRNELLKEKSIYLYGCGVRGKATLQRMEQVKDICKWKLQGIIDQNEQIYEYNGEKKVTISIEKIDCLRWDYILISSKRYYEDIKNKLISLGVYPEKIISDSIIYYI